MEEKQLELLNEVCQAFSLKSYNDCTEISKFDINRIELCTNKEKDGLTPSKNSIIKSLKLNIPIHPIIRPRGGNFLYNKAEFKQMIESINNRQFINDDKAVVV